MLAPDLLHTLSAIAPVVHLHVRYILGDIATPTDLGRRVAVQGVLTVVIDDAGYLALV